MSIPLAYEPGAVHEAAVGPTREQRRARGDDTHHPMCCPQCLRRLFVAVN